MCSECTLHRIFGSRRHERKVVGEGTPGSRFWGSFQDMGEEERTSGAYRRIGTGWPSWVYLCTLSPVLETLPRACPSSLRLGRHRRWHSVHKAAPVREQSVFFPSSKGRLLSSELTTSGAFLCLVPPLPSGQLTNALSGLTNEAAFDF